MSEEDEVTLGEKLRQAMTTLLSIVELRKEQDGATINLVQHQIHGRGIQYSCFLLQFPCPPAVCAKLDTAAIEDLILHSDGRSLNTNADWDRVILATLLTYQGLERKADAVWEGSDAEFQDVLNTFITNYIVVSGWKSAEDFKKTSFATFKKYYHGFSCFDVGQQPGIGYFRSFLTESDQAKEFDYKYSKQKQEVIFGTPKYNGIRHVNSEGDAGFVLSMRRALMFFYFLLKCPAGSLIQSDKFAPGSESKIEGALKKAVHHDRFMQIYTAKQRLSTPALISQLAAQACDNFLFDNNRLKVVEFAKAQLEEEGDNKRRSRAARRARSSAGHSALAAFPASCNLSETNVAGCPDDCPLSLFAASCKDESQRHYVAEYLYKRLKPGPEFELCVFGPHVQAALFASRLPFTEPGAMYKAVHTPPEVAKEVDLLHGSCTDTQSVWNGRHPLASLPGGAEIHAALCAAHPTIAAVTSYANFVEKHQAVASSLLTTPELYSAYRVGLLACYALFALGGERRGLQEAISLATSVVAREQAGAAVHAVFNHCQYWLPLAERGSLVAANKLPNDRYLLLISDQNNKLSVQPVSADEYNSLAMGWTQWYTQRLLFDLGCWEKYQSGDSDLIQADLRRITEAGQAQQTVVLSSWGRIAFAWWSLGKP